MAKGTITLDGQPLREGDGAAVTGERKLSFTAGADAEILVFDLA